MNSLEQMKTKIINDYMSLIDINENIDYHKIENELAIALGERPAVQMEYLNDTQLNEDGKIVKKISKLKSINIIFTYDENNMIKVGKKTYIVA